MTVEIGVRSYNQDLIYNEYKELEINEGLWKIKRETINGKSYILLTGEWEDKTSAPIIQKEFLRYIKSHHDYLFNFLLNILGEKEPDEDFNTLSEVYSLYIATPVVSKKKISAALYIDKQDLDIEQNRLSDIIYTESLSIRDIPYFLFAPKGDNLFILKHKFNYRIKGYFKLLTLTLTSKTNDKGITTLSTSIYLEKERMEYKDKAEPIINTSYEINVDKWSKPIDSLIDAKEIINLSLNNL
jgi:hypothetical protein